MMPDAPANSVPFEATPQVDAFTHYNPLKYLSPQRLASVGYQLQFLPKHFDAKSVLEIGVGTGLTSRLLKDSGYCVTTLDIDPSLAPDVVGSVSAIPLPDDAVDAFCCCQVLEHLPWESIGSCLAELNRACRIGGIVSVPTQRRQLNVSTYSARHSRQKYLQLPQRFPKPMRTTDGQHYWELDANIRTSQFKDELAKAGFVLVFDLQPIENTYHHFFVVKKK